MAEQIAGRIQDAWGKARALWRGEAADAFHRQYIVPLRENAERFDAACRELEDRTQMLDRALSAIERDLSE